MEFHSITYLGSSSQSVVNGYVVQSSYNVNEILTHKIDPAYGKKYNFLILPLILLGAGIGAFSAIVLFKKTFPAFWFFGLSVIGALGGLIALAFLLSHLAERKQAAVERSQHGYTGRFVTVPDEKWDRFLAALRSQEESKRMVDILKGR